MAETVEVNLKVTGTEKATANIAKVDGATKNLGSSFDATGGAVGLLSGSLDKMTGGAFSGLMNTAKGLKVFITGLKTTKSAIVATGIGALVVAFGLLVTYWDDIKAAVDGVSSEQKTLLKNAQDTTKAAEQNLGLTQASESSLKLAGKSEREIRDLKIQQTNEVILATEAVLEQQKQMKKTQVEAAERNQKIAAGVIGFLMAPITLLLGAIDALTYGLAKVGVLNEATNLAEDTAMWAASFLFDPEEVAKEGSDTIDETEKQLLALKNKRDAFTLQNQADDKSASDKRRAEREAEAEAAKKAEAEATATAKATAEAERVARENLEDELYALSLSAKERAELLVQQTYDKRVAIAGDDEGLLKSAEERLIADLAAIQKKADDDKEVAQKAIDDRLAAEKQIADDKKIASEEAAAEAVKQARLGIVASGFDALKSMAKTEEGQKRLAISQILVNQGIAMSEAFRGATQAASGTGPAAAVAMPIFYAQMIGMVLSSFASIKGVMNQAGAGGGSIGSGGKGGGTSLALTPSLDSFQPGTLELPAVQAYVLQNNIADADALAQALQNQSSL